MPVLCPEHGLQGQWAGGWHSHEGKAQVQVNTLWPAVHPLTSPALSHPILVNVIFQGFYSNLPEMTTWTTGWTWLELGGQCHCDLTGHIGWNGDVMAFYMQWSVTSKGSVKTLFCPLFNTTHINGVHISHLVRYRIVDNINYCIVLLG